MKKFLFFLFVCLIGFSMSSAIAQSRRSSSNSSWNLKFSGGSLISSMDSKMQLSDGDGYTFEDYSGRVGVEGQVAIQVGRLETAYTLQYYYSTKKDGSITIDGTTYDEEGDLNFFNELFDVNYYIIDEPILTGFTLSVGIGKGTSRIEIDSRKIAGTDQTNQMLYAKILHYNATVHYELTNLFFAKATIRVLNINAVKQDNFTNTTYSLSGGVKF